MMNEYRKAKNAISRLENCLNTGNEFTDESIDIARCQLGNLLEDIRSLTQLNNELVEALREALAIMSRYRQETPLGHQPHMIAHQADASIVKASELIKKARSE